MTTAQDQLFMVRAMQLARSGRYPPHPNPRVGCVLVQKNDVIGEGWHRYAGGPHAEIVALNSTVKSTQGATAYVTLEPCNHHGRTPPCVDALIEAGIARVVVAMQDPNPRVSGQGIQRLMDAGVEVESGLLSDEAETLNLGFIKRMRHGTPYVRSKLAMSLDGRTAMASGESKWITGSAARADVQRLRAASSAILTGIGTVLSDNPRLTARLEESDWGVSIAETPAASPLRVVVDSQLRIPLDAAILQQAGKTVIFSCHNGVEKISQLKKLGVEVVLFEGRQPELSVILAALAARQINDVMVEAGSILNGALLSQNLVDEMIIYMAPSLLGDGAKGLFHLPELKSMQDKIALKIVDIRAIGDDWRITVKLK